MGSGRVPEAVRKAIGYKAGAERIAAAFAATGPRASADALEDLLRVRRAGGGRRPSGPLSTPMAGAVTSLAFA